MPCYKVYEDKLFLGFLDISPLNPGNTLLIPKIHYRWVYDVPEFGMYFETARRIGFAIQRVVSADSINFLTVGDEVPHAHIRIIPRFVNDGGVFELKNIKNIPKEKMQLIAEQILQKTASFV